MPTNTNSYNSRVTDEALEKRFRDTFRSQGGAELVDDLYAQGVIVPVVDFTAAATGNFLAENLQTAWDSSTGNQLVTGNTFVNVITNAGFWQVDLTHSGYDQANTAASAVIRINQGALNKPIWARTAVPTGGLSVTSVIESKFVVFLRAGDNLQARGQFTGSTPDQLDIWYRQIATVNGDLVNPSGFTFS